MENNDTIVSGQSIAVIPARGGSKRIPKKNIKLFHGKPIIFYPIDVAKKSGLFSKIIVSTDDPEIATVALSCGAEVPFLRPSELANDYTGTDEVLAHALHWLDEQKLFFESTCCIYPANPLINEKYLREGLNLLKTSNATSVISITHYPYSIFRSLRINNSQRVEMMEPEFLETRSQDLPNAYHDASQFYWLNTRKYLSVGKIFNDDTVPLILPRHQVQDIDTMEDWVIAEKLSALYKDA